jgi:hypothetical protein
MSIFAELKQGDPTKFWAKIQPEIISILEQLNTEVFNSEWRIVNPYNSLFIDDKFPRLSSHGSVGLHKWTTTFIAVCPEPEGDAVRIYISYGRSARILRKVEFERFVESLKYLVDWMLKKQG